MENGPLHDDKLFRAVNDRLSNYEAPYEGADWDAMSRSLDQLPKATRYTFNWKISLNSILIGVGILSVSLLGLAFAGSGGKNKNAASANIPVVQAKNNVNAPIVPVQNVAMNNAASTVLMNDASVQDNNGLMSNSATNTMQSIAAGTTHRKNSNNGLYFGDQIDPRKGFIYKTQETNSLVGSHTDSTPSTYYDIADGQRKTIHIDSAQHHKFKPNGDSASTASGNGAPTGQDRTGFDVQFN